MSEEREVKPVLVVGIRRPADVDQDWGGGVSARRLERLLGVQRGRLLEAVDGINLLGPEDEESGARLKAAASLVEVDQRECLILCGDLVRTAFGICTAWRSGDDVLVTTVRGTTALCIPHPSGRNRDWNDPDTTARVAAALRSVTTPLIDPELLEDGDEVRRARAAVVSVREWRAGILAALAVEGTVAGAARSVGVAVSTVWLHMRRDPEFKLAMSEDGAAMETFRASIEAEIRRRAIEGVPEPIMYQGKPVGAVRRYSDQVLLAMAARHIKPYREGRKVDVSHGIQPGAEVTIAGLLAVTKAAVEEGAE